MEELGSREEQGKQVLSLPAVGESVSLSCLFFRHAFIGWYLAQTSSFLIGCSAFGGVVGLYPNLLAHPHCFSRLIPEKGQFDGLRLQAVSLCFKRENLGMHVVGIRDISGILFSQLPL